MSAIVLQYALFHVLDELAEAVAQLPSKELDKYNLESPLLNAQEVLTEYMKEKDK